MTGLKEQLRAGKQVLGTMVTTFTTVDLAKVLKESGFDFMMIDCEHGAFTTREVANHISVARSIAFPALVRIPEMRREHALKYLEMGANGLLLPNTESAEEAAYLVECSKYAPAGKRGVSLSRPHTDFKKVNKADYMEKANRETLLMVQIESKKGVENIDEILAVPGIDVGFIGPNDMSQDYGILGQYSHPEIVAAFEKIMKTAEKYKIYSGVHFGHAEPLRPWIKRGMQINMWNSDSLGAAQQKELRPER